MKRYLSLVIMAAVIAAMLAVPLPMMAQEGTPPNPAPDVPPSPPTLYLPVIVAPTSGSEVAQSPVETSADAAISLDDLLTSDAGAKPLDAINASNEGAPAPEPGLDSPVSESADEKLSTIESDVMIEASAVDGWMTIKSEGFEGTFPNSSWRVYDNNGATSGEYYWDDDDYLRHSGSWSAWAANGGANALDPQVYNYPNNMQSWMVYGPFDLSNAADAELLFYYWNRSEANYDYFGWYASANGTNFYGTRVSGDSGGWKYVNFDLTAVPGLGNLKGDSSVWIAFVFTSDGSVTSKGPFVDDIILQKLVNTVSCPNQYKAEYFNNRTLSGSPTVTRCENWPINYSWGNGSPVSGIGSDNFSVRWSGTASFSAGTYTFVATADDGIRVWLDNALIIDGWRDQAETTYRAVRSVTAGSHAVKVEYYENGGGATAKFSWQATKKVVLDPGHGWCNGTPGASCTITPGAVANSMKEKDVVLDIAQRTKALLEARGVQVFMTRNGDDPYHTLSYAAQFVNQTSPNLSVSIHANAGGGTGTEACYQDNKTTTQQSKDVSTRMTAEIASRLTLTNRGIFSEYNSGRCGRGGQLYIHDMAPTAALIETAFIDSTADAAKLRDRRQDFAQALANAICLYLGVP